MASVERETDSKTLPGCVRGEHSFVGEMRSFSTAQIFEHAQQSPCNSCWPCPGWSARRLQPSAADGVGCSSSVAGNASPPETSLVVINGVQKRKTNFLKRKTSPITHCREFKQNITECPRVLTVIIDVLWGTHSLKQSQGSGAAPISGRRYSL